ARACRRSRASTGGGGPRLARLPMDWRGIERVASAAVQDMHDAQFQGQLDAARPNVLRAQIARTPCIASTMAGQSSTTAPPTAASAAVHVRVVALETKVAALAAETWR